MGSKTKRSADQKPPPLWVEDAHADLLQRRITTTGKELFVYIADLFSGPVAGLALADMALTAFGSLPRPKESWAEEHVSGDAFLLFRLRVLPP